MNQIILMAEIVQSPQLRYTPDNQTAIAELWVQFAGLRDEDPLAKIRVVAWGNLAQDVQANYHEGDRVVLEGRLGMVNVDRPEGFKEKRAELTVSRIHRLNSDTTITTNAAAAPVAQTAAQPQSATPATTAKTQTRKTSAKPTVSEPVKTPAYPAAEIEPADFDDIPF
jgi:single-stranded DNA-binding protein